MNFSLIKKAWAAAAPVTPPDNPLGSFTQLHQILGFVMNIVFYVGIAMTVIFLIMGGIRYVTSGGSKEGAEAARSMITNAIIGFIVVIGAFAIKIIVQNVLGADPRTVPLIPGF